jgi:hypothetical protein
LKQQNQWIFRYYRKYLLLLVDKLYHKIGFNSVAANLANCKIKGFEATVIRNSYFSTKIYMEYLRGFFSANRRNIITLYGYMVDIKDEEEMSLVKRGGRCEESMVIGKIH